jgi:DNA-binding response OmpR family regulator
VNRILIVEDERDLLDSLREFFEDQGFSVLTAENGAEALELMSEGDPPSVVVLDLVMPVVDGNEVFSRMQREPRLSKVPVIVSTSDPSRAPSGVLTLRKPVNLQNLLGAIQARCSAARVP